MKKLLIFTFFSVSLVACSGDKVLSVEHYKEHEAERTERLKECQRLTQAEFAVNKNCAHAIAAEKEIENEKPLWFNLESK